MYVYCNFYCSPAKKNSFDTQLFWASDDNTLVTDFLPMTRIIVHLVSLHAITRWECIRRRAVVTNDPRSRTGRRWRSGAQL